MESELDLKISTQSHIKASVSDSVTKFSNMTLKDFCNCIYGSKGDNDTMVEQRDWESMSLAEVESYGSNLQIEVSDKMSSLLKMTKCISLEQTGKVLSDLSVESNTIVKKLTGVKALSPVVKISKWVSRFDSIESRIDSLEKGVVEEKARLDDILDKMYESFSFMQSKLTEYELAQQELTSAVEYYQSNDNDGLRLQAAVSRLKVITTMVAVVKQECVKTLMIIKDNKEVTSQLTEAADNLIPIFKLELMNVIGAKTNAEAVKLKKSLAKTANQIIVDNAKQIEKTTDDLIEGRNSSLIEPKTIEEANRIIQNAITKIRDSAVIETDANLKAIADMQNSLGKLNGLSLPEGIDT